jgi:REase_DpnII-MboI
MTASHLLLQDARLMLRRRISSLCGRRDLEEAFAGWILNDETYGPDTTACAVKSMSRLALARDHRDVAILGYALSLAKIPPAVSPTVMFVFNEAMARLAGRPPSIDGHPAAFCFDGLSILGCALGAAASGGQIRQETSSWLFRLVSLWDTAKGAPDWQRSLISAAAHVLDVPKLAAQRAGLDFADVQVALRARGVLPAVQQSVAEQDEVAAIQLARLVVDSIPDARACLREAALAWVARHAPTVGSERHEWADLAALLRRVPAGLRRWTWEARPRTKGRGSLPRHWHIDNEYHVQNLLYTVLAPVYPDLLDELILEPFGQLHPRADLCVPSLKSVVEVKFVRAGTSFAKIIEEVASDAVVYFARRDLYERMIVFIWDDSSRVQEHDLAAQGLLKISGVADAIIVSRPGNFSRAPSSHPERPTASDEPNADVNGPPFQSDS